MSFFSNAGGKWRVVAVAAVCSAALVLGVLFVGCGSSSQQSAEQYRNQWKSIMETFYTKLQADDKKAEQLASQKNNAAIIQLVNGRVNGVEATMGQILALKPPAQYRKLDAITLYFMVALMDQLQAQNDLNKATVSGQPTTDLVTKVDNLSKGVQAVSQELSIEQLTQGITLQQPKGSQSQQQGTTPSTTTPSTAPKGK
jgi:hypothetical protein